MPSRARSLPAVMPRRQPPAASRPRPTSAATCRGHGVPANAGLVAGCAIRCTVWRQLPGRDLLVQPSVPRRRRASPRPAGRACSTLRRSRRVRTSKRASCGRGRSERSTCSRAAPRRRARSCTSPPARGRRRRFRRTRRVPCAHHDGGERLYALPPLRRHRDCPGPLHGAGATGPRHRARTGRAGHRPPCPGYNASTQRWTDPCAVSHDYAEVMTGATITATETFTVAITVSWSDGVAIHTEPVPCDPNGGDCHLTIGAG